MSNKKKKLLHPSQTKPAVPQETKENAGEEQDSSQDAEALEEVSPSGILLDEMSDDPVQVLLACLMLSAITGTPVAKSGMGHLVEMLQESGTRERKTACQTLRYTLTTVRRAATDIEAELSRIERL